jgi:hypothetical protein
MPGLEIQRVLYCILTVRAWASVKGWRLVKEQESGSGSVLLSAKGKTLGTPLE